MPTPEKLGGFKVLKGVERMLLASPSAVKDFPSRVFGVLADRKINLPYATCVRDRHAWALTLVVEAGDAAGAAAALDGALGMRPVVQTGSAILSIFPHRKNPEIIRTLFETFEREAVAPDALACSPSAISMVIEQTMLNRASSSLFGPFTFSAYRTPADWKMAQKGKEQIYKEVVASYQEKRPKVYGLEYQDHLALLQAKLERGRMGALGPLFGRLARPGLSLAFLAASPCEGNTQEEIAFCVPLAEESLCGQALHETAPHAPIASLASAAVFSMNGPHFGDRYGIVNELLKAFETNHVDLLGLSCTIASITGVIPSSLLTTGIAAIQARFDIPSIIERT
jgi:aspartokinase